MNAAFTGLSFAPVIPPLALAVLAAAALAVWGLALARRARGAWWRLIPMAALVLALANPKLVAEERQSLPDIAVVLVDDSLSQAMGERRAQTEAALADLTERLGREANLEVRVERVTASSGADDGTRMFEALDNVLADMPRNRLAGIVMITDGRVHDVPQDRLAALGAPVHALLTGRPDERDRRLAIISAPGFALVGKAATITVKVDDPGISGSARVDVRVGGQDWLSASVPLNRDAAIEIPVRHAGQVVVELAVEPAPGELSLANNQTAIGISGVRDRLKVLLISGEPHAGERTWRNLLKADPAVDLVHFTILRPPDKDDRTPIRELALITFPVRELFEEKLPEFDLVVFDRYRRRGVLNSVYYQALADYVRDGGALLAAVGPEFAEGMGLADSPLGEVLPAAPTDRVIAEPFKPRLTETGRRHPVTSALPGSGGPGSGGPGSGAPGSGGEDPEWGDWLRQIGVRSLRGMPVLSGAQDEPLVVLDKVGEGRVALVLSDTIWLWARGYQGGGPHDELLRRLSHWLMKEPELEEESLSAEIKGDRLEVVRRSLEAPPATLTLTRPDGSVAELALTDQGDGRAIAAADMDQPGLWRVDDGERTAIAAAGSLAPLEMAELTATDEWLEPVAKATGGSTRFLSESGPPALRRVGEGRIASGRDWIGLASRGGHVVTGMREVPLVPGLIVLFLALGGLLMAWRAEGK